MATLEDSGSMCCAEESGAYDIIAKTPNVQKMDLDADKLKRPMSQKQSDRYSARDRSNRDDKMLCDS